MKRHIRTILTVGLSLTLSAMTVAQDSRVTKRRPIGQPPKHPNVVKPKVILPVVPEPHGKSTAPEPKPFLGGFAGNPGGGFGLGGGFAGSGGFGLGGGFAGSGGFGLGGGFAGTGIQGGSTGLGTAGYGGGSLGPVTERLSAADRMRLLEKQYRDRGSRQYGPLKQYYSDYERMIDSSPFQLPAELKALGAVCPPIDEFVKMLKFVDYEWQLLNLIVGETISGHQIDRAEAAAKLAADIAVDQLFDLLNGPWKELTKPLKDAGFGTVADLAKHFLEAKTEARQGAEAFSDTSKKK